LSNDFIVIGTGIYRIGDIRRIKDWGDGAVRIFLISGETVEEKDDFEALACLIQRWEE